MEMCVSLGGSHISRNAALTKTIHKSVRTFKTPTLASTKLHIQKIYFYNLPFSKNLDFRKCASRVGLAPHFSDSMFLRTLRGGM